MLLFLVTFVVALLIAHLVYRLDADEAKLFGRFIAGGNLAINIVLVIIIAAMAHAAVDARRTRVAAIAGFAQRRRRWLRRSPPPASSRPPATGGSSRGSARGRCSSRIRRSGKHQLRLGGKTFRSATCSISCQSRGRAGSTSTPRWPARHHTDLCRSSGGHAEARRLLCRRRGVDAEQPEDDRHAATADGRAIHAD